jgi:hypothetical protein
VPPPSSWVVLVTIAILDVLLPLLRRGLHGVGSSYQSYWSCRPR